MYLLGIDLGSSSVKASLVEITTGKVLSSASSPEVEMTINAPEPGYAEQYPDIWWENLKSACHRIKTQFDYDPLFGAIVEPLILAKSCFRHWEKKIVYRICLIHLVILQRAN